MSARPKQPNTFSAYTCVNDVTAAEVLNENGDFAQWCRSKGYDTFAAWARDHNGLRLGRGAGHYTPGRSGAAELPAIGHDHSASELVSFISHDMTLLPGDVIAVGTSLGVGSMKDGATVEVQIDGI